MSKVRFHVTQRQPCVGCIIHVILHDYINSIFYCTNFTTAPTKLTLQMTQSVAMKPASYRLQVVGAQGKWKELVSFTYCNNWNVLFFFSFNDLNVYVMIPGYMNIKFLYSYVFYVIMLGHSSKYLDPYII